MAEEILVVGVQEENIQEKKTPAENVQEKTVQVDDGVEMPATESLKCREMSPKLTLKECVFFLLAFLVPTVLMALIWGGLGITYGGQVTPLLYDMEIQYLPFFASLRYLLSGENTPFFTWGVALGGNYYGLWAYYMASPLSWITILFDLKDMPDAIYVLTLLKIGLCGLTFSIFTRFGLSEKRCGVINVFFSCCYALMSYNIMYGMSLMWLDGVILLPLILLGIEKLMQGKKGAIYFVSILATFACNYYISYMIGLFAAVYVLCRVIATHSKTEWKRALGVLVRFGVLSLFALGMAMPVLLPAMQSVALGKSSESQGVDSFPKGAYEFAPWEIFKKMLPGQYDSINNSGLPLIYCGSLMVILAVVFLLQKRQSKKEKVTYLLMLAFSIIGFWNRYVDYAFHAFQYPTAFPYRYAFLFPVVVMIMAWKAYAVLPKKTDFSKLLTLIAVFYGCVELFFNGSAIVSGLHNETSYGVRSAYDISMELREPLMKTIKDEKGFYRAEVGYDMGNLNAALMYGVNGMSSYVSTYNSNVNIFYYIMGARKYGFVSHGLHLTPVGDSLMGVKYRLDTDSTHNGYKLKQTSQVVKGESVYELYLHENPNALSLGYLIPRDKIYSSLTLTPNPFINQNMVLEMLGVEDYEVFSEIVSKRNVENNIASIEFTAPSEHPVYMYVNGYRIEETDEDGLEGGIEMTLKTLGDEQSGWITMGNCVCLDNCEGGVEVNISFGLEGVELYDIYLYEMDMQVYENAMNQLKEGQMEIMSYAGGNVKGRVTAKKDEHLLVTMPVDTGYRILVDGQETNYGSALGTFLVIPLTEGEHDIEISYISYGFLQGMQVAKCSLVLVVVYCITCMFQENRKNINVKLRKKEENRKK